MTKTTYTAERLTTINLLPELMAAVEDATLAQKRYLNVHETLTGHSRENSTTIETEYVRFRLDTVMSFKVFKVRVSQSRKALGLTMQKQVKGMADKGFSEAMYTAAVLKYHAAREELERLESMYHGMKSEARKYNAGMLRRDSK